jgi:hypothetical protein
MEVQGETIRFVIEYDPDELIRPLVFYVDREPWYQRVLDKPQGVILNFLGAVVVLYFLDLVTLTSVLLAAVAAVAVAAFAPTAVIHSLSALALHVHQKYRAQMEKVPPQRYEFEFGPEGIKSRYQRDVEMTEWSDVTKAIESELDILIWHHEKSSYIFPKRIFQDFDELATFKNFIRSNIGERADF